MIVDTVLGNVSDLTAAELDGLHVEKVVLPLAELTKRVQRVTTDHGSNFWFTTWAMPLSAAQHISL